MVHAVQDRVGPLHLGRLPVHAVLYGDPRTSRPVVRAEDGLHAPGQHGVVAVVVVHESLHARVQGENALPRPRVDGAAQFLKGAVVRRFGAPQKVDHLRRDAHRVADQALQVRLFPEEHRVVHVEEESTARQHEVLQVTVPDLQHHADGGRKGAGP